MPSARTLLAESKRAHFLVRFPAERAEVFNGRRDTCLAGHSSLLSRLFRSTPEAKCFIVRTGASPRVACVPQITVLKIPLIVLGPRVVRRAVELPAGWKKLETEGKKEQFARLGAKSPLFQPGPLLLWVKLERTTRWNELGPWAGRRKVTAVCLR